MYYFNLLQYDKKTVILFTSLFLHMFLDFFFCKPMINIISYFSKLYVHIIFWLDTYSYSRNNFFKFPYKMFRRRQWQPTPVLLPGKSHGQRSLIGWSSWGREESDTTERLHFHFSLSCIGEGNGNPLQCSCLENPRDGEAWWAAIYGVAQSQTRLKRLSSRSSSKESFQNTIWK